MDRRTDQGVSKRRRELYGALNTDAAVQSLIQAVADHFRFQLCVLGGFAFKQLIDRCPEDIDPTSEMLQFQRGSLMKLLMDR